MHAHYGNVTDLCSLVTRGAQLFGDATALELPEAGEAFTYRELASSVFDIANWLGGRSAFVAATGSP